MHRFLTNTSPFFSLWLVLFIIPTAGYSQTSLSDEAMVKLEKMELFYAYPTDRSFFARQPVGKKYLKADWAIRNTDWSLEVWYYLEPVFNDPKDQVPQVQMMSRVWTWATNEDETAEVAVRTLSRAKSKELYGADFVGYIDFIPKTQLTEKPFGKALFMHREGFGNAYVVFFFDEPDTRVDHLFPLLQFQGATTVD